MNSNLEWQTHQAQERVQACLREAAVHRQLEENNHGRSQRKAWRILMVLAMIILLLLWTDLAKGWDGSASWTAATQAQLTPAIVDISARGHIHESRMEDSGLFTKHRSLIISS